MNHTPYITFLGGGNMATAMIAGLVQSGGVNPSFIRVVDTNEAQRDRLHTDFGVLCFESVDFAVAQANTPSSVWVLAVKPQVMHEALNQLTPHLTGTETLVSVAAGLSIDTLRQWSNGHTHIVRAMPNTPALVGQGITGVYAPDATAQQRDTAQLLLAHIGQIIWLNTESQIDDITAISGSGPAYVFYMMEQLMRDAEQLGFDAATAKQLVLGTFAGAVALAAESTETIATLRERVTSKGGTTAAALDAFRSNGLDAALHAGVVACKDRAHSLAAELSSN